MTFAVLSFDGWKQNTFLCRLFWCFEIRPVSVFRFMRAFLFGRRLTTFSYRGGIKEALVSLSSICVLVISTELGVWVWFVSPVRRDWATNFYIEADVKFPSLVSQMTYLLWLWGVSTLSTADKPYPLSPNTLLRNPVLKHPLSVSSHVRRDHVSHP